MPPRQRRPQGRVERVLVGPESPGLDRELAVYLPPSYGDGDRRYPVLYMQDGQNLFDPEGGPGRAGEYVSHLAETIKLLVDARFRTLPRRETTGVAGSSMGGLVSLFAFFARPDVFGVMAH